MASYGVSGIYEFINTNGVFSVYPTTFAGASYPVGLAFNSAGDLFEADSGSGYINEFINKNGVLSTTPTAFAFDLNRPVGLAFDSAGDLFEADYGGARINEFIDNNGVLSTNSTLFASGLNGPAGLAFSPPPPGPLTVTKLQAKVNLNPARKNIDTCSLTASPALESGFNVANQPVMVDVGWVQEYFTLNAKGIGKGSGKSCKLSYTKKTEVWTLTASMKNGSWATLWAEYGATNTTTPKAGVTVQMPVLVVIGTNRFATEQSLLYKATAGKSGTLR